MKKLLLLLIIALSVAPSQAQFTNASLQATGLTCAMCSNAINKALQKVPFVESVKSDIKNSAFSIVFKADTQVDIGALKDAVEDAGFSIGSLKLTGVFAGINVEKNQPVKFGSDTFLFLNAGSQVLNGEKTITIVDKNFMTAKEFKKQNAAVKIYKLPANTERVYYVII